MDTVTSTTDGKWFALIQFYNVSHIVRRKSWREAMSINRTRFVDDILTSMTDPDQATDENRLRAQNIEARLYWSTKSYVSYKCEITTKCLKLLRKRVDNLDALVKLELKGHK